VDYGVISFDGESYPVKGAPAYDASSYKQVNASTFEGTRLVQHMRCPVPSTERGTRYPSLLR